LGPRHCGQSAARDEAEGAVESPSPALEAVAAVSREGRAGAGSPAQAKGRVRNKATNAVRMEVDSEGERRREEGYLQAGSTNWLTMFNLRQAQTNCKVRRDGAEVAAPNSEWGVGVPSSSPK
jgi:hypothetical protein